MIIALDTRIDSPRPKPVTNLTALCMHFFMTCRPSRVKTFVRE